MEKIAEREGKFALYWNESHGSVLCDLAGFWDITDIEAFFPLIDSAARQSRQRHGQALILFDTRKAQVMSSRVFEALQNERMNVTAQDRIAIVLESNLLKIQSRRVTEPGSNSEYFTSLTEAENWLHTGAAA